MYLKRVKFLLISLLSFSKTVCQSSLLGLTLSSLIVLKSIFYSYGFINISITI